MSATFALLVLGAPLASQAPQSALSFATAAVAAGHHISCVFFLDEGVYCGNSQSETAAAPGIAQRWAELASATRTELILCVASAMKRGMLDAEQASRRGHAAGVVAPPFILGGLGQWVTACIEADHVVSFGA